jgi:hypothetical protein
MQTPLPRTPLDRLVDAGRILRTVAKLIVSDVDEALAGGDTEVEVALALGLPATGAPAAIAEELDALRRWTT